jgi:hypothetical protein
VTLIDQWPDHVEAMKGWAGLWHLRRAPDSGALHLCELQSVAEPRRRVHCRETYDTEWRGLGSTCKPDGVIVDFRTASTMSGYAAAGRERCLGCVIPCAA